MTPIDPISDTVVNRIAEACTRIPDHPAIVDKGGAVKLSQLWETAAALAGQLSGLPGFAREERFDFSFGQAKFDLLLNVYPNREALELVLEYSTATVAPAQAQSWLRAFLELMERLTAHEHQESDA